jgi:hypothetical protein
MGDEIIASRRALSHSYATLASVAASDAESDYWWDMHLDIEEELADS